MYFLAEVLIIAFAIALPVFVTRWARRRPGWLSRWPRLVGAAAFVVVFMGEELAGRAQMLFMCPTAKVEVYGSVTIPSMFFDDSGEPLFVRNGVPDTEKTFGPGVSRRRISHYVTESYSSVRRGFVYEAIFCFRETNTRRPLACATSYAVIGGWTKDLVNVDFLGLPRCGPTLYFDRLLPQIIRSE